MRFKLLGLEQLTKIKERWFREGLRTRLRLFCAFLARKGTAALNAEKVQITFSRSLPVNDLEIAQTLATYHGARKAAFGAGTLRGGCGGCREIAEQGTCGGRWQATGSVRNNAIQEGCW